MEDRECDARMGELRVQEEVQEGPVPGRGDWQAVRTQLTKSHTCTYLNLCRKHIWFI